MKTVDIDGLLVTVPEGGDVSTVFNQPVGTKITRLAFRNRFTFTEKVAIAEAGKTDVMVEVLLKDQDAATYIELSRSDTQQGVQLLASKGLITAERAAEILSLTVLPDEEYRG